MVTYTAHGPGRVVAFSDSVWLAVKLVALALMVLDHVDWGLFGSSLGIHDTIGRAVFPLFALTLGRSVILGPPGHLLRVVAPRMALVGAVASLAYVPLFGVYPLNVMFTLAAGVAMVALWRMGWGLVAVAVFVSAGALVDYQWFGLACIAVAAWTFSWPRLPVGGLLAVMAVLLLPVNGSLWALLAVPLFALASVFDGPAPRLKWLFYAAYPVHLAVLAIAAVALP